MWCQQGALKVRLYTLCALLCLLSGCAQRAQRELPRQGWDRYEWTHRWLSEAEKKQYEEGPTPCCYYPAFMADGLVYTAFGPLIHSRALSVEDSDGTILYYMNAWPFLDGMTNEDSSLIGSPYIKMNGGAWLLGERGWYFYKHDGPQLDIPDEEDVLGHPRRELRPAWLTFLLEHTPPPLTGWDPDSWQKWLA